MRQISIAELTKVISERRPQLIAIDGFLGAGKSTLAKRIAEDVEYRCINLDDFVPPNEGRFASNLDFSRLSESLKGDHLTIVEGVCVLSVLKRIGLKCDMLIFVVGEQPGNLTANPVLVNEVRTYLKRWSPAKRADYVVDMNQERDSGRTQVDIAYIKAKTTLAVVLAIGGMLSICVGLVVFAIGTKGDDSTLFKVVGFEISAKGLGAVILATSTLWAYLAYLARPKYSRSRERKVSTATDGSSQSHEVESATLQRTSLYTVKDP
jgi:adenylate kinase family enzyme